MPISSVMGASGEGDADAVEFVSEDDVLGVQADLRTDMVRDQITVAGQNLHHHAIATECCERLGGIGQRRVSKGEETSQRQVVLISDAIGLLRRGRP